jgi:hypothetical protein
MSYWLGFTPVCSTQTRPITSLRFLARLCAAPSGTYPSSSIAARTRARVLSRTGPCPCSTRETVAIETPARRATS